VGNGKVQSFHLRVVVMAPLLWETRLPSPVRYRKEDKKEESIAIALD
jgi:hypothetical protein